MFTKAGMRQNIMGRPLHPPNLFINIHQIFKTQQPILEQAKDDNVRHSFSYKHVEH